MCVDRGYRHGLGASRRVLGVSARNGGEGGSLGEPVARGTSMSMTLQGERAYGQGD